MADSRPRNLQAALAYADLGFAVFPTRPRSKVPLTPNGFKDATLDHNRITKWWELEPAAGVAIATGKVSNLTVLDFDPRNGSDESLLAIQQQCGQLPITPKAATGGGGSHLCFQYEARAKSGKLLPGVDCQNDGRYIVSPFSMHASGVPYQWVDSPTSVALAPFPTSVLDVFVPQEEDPQVAPREPNTFAEGERNLSLTSLAGTMRRRGMTPESILKAISSENDTKCNPPLPAEEIERIVASVVKYDPQDPMKVNRWAPGDLKGILDPTAGQIKYLVDGLIAESEVVLLAASWKTGKTMLGYRALLDCIQGQPIFDYYPIERSFPVAFFQLEMPKIEEERRIRRLALGQGPTPLDLVQLVEDGLFKPYHRPPMNLSRADDVAQFQEIVINGGFRLVVIDSLTAAFAGANFNDASEVRLHFTRAFNRLTDLGVSILLFHHFRKANAAIQEDTRDRVLGSQAWAASANRILALTRIEGGAPPDAGENYFRVKLEALGAWGPDESPPVFIACEDPTPETTTVKVVGETGDFGSTTSLAAQQIADLVQDNPGIDRETALAGVTVVVSKRTLQRAFQLAINNGKVKVEKKELYPG